MTLLGGTLAMEGKWWSPSCQAWLDVGGVLEGLHHFLDPGLGGGVREVDDNDHDQDNDDYEENYHDETLMIKIIMTIMMITMTITVPGLQGRRS